MKEAMFYKKLDGFVQCNLCPHKCLITDGNHGKCLIRKNIDGCLYALGYGRIISAQVDPIEKKPLYHYYPGSQILSVGFSGCNMRCQFCQNYQLSQEFIETDIVPVDKLLASTKEALAFTYNEPFINFEYVYDVAVGLKKQGKRVVLVTNGLVSHQPLKKLLPFVDAFNVDLKGNEAFYKQMGGQRKQVLDNLLLMAEKHLEVTTLLVNNHVSLEDIEEISKEVAAINQDIPFHISRYFPSYQMFEEETPLSLMIEAKEVAKKHLNHVYLGNMNADQNTYCSACGRLLIERFRYQTSVKISQCPCGQDNNIEGDI